MDKAIEEIFTRALQAQESGNVALAAQNYADLLELCPENARAANNLGNLMLGLGHLPEAGACFARALASEPGMIEATYNLARLDQIAGRLQEAERGYTAVLQSVRLEQAAYNRAIVLRDMGYVDEAAEAYLALLSWAPEHAHAWNNLGKIRRERGELPEAVAAFEQAVRCAPDDAEIASNRLFCLLHDSDTTPERLCVAQHQFAARFEAGLRPGWPHHACSCDPERPLRVGFVSADLRNHPVGRFLLPLIEGLARDAIVAVAFSNAPVEDEVSVALRQGFAEWYTIFGLNDVAAADLIVRQRIDVLVDLSGHTAGNRLGVFARKPAPVQATWMGYLGSTGLAAMDWRITDAACDPPELEAWHSERLVRLPACQWCYRPPACQVAPAPERREGLWLGSFTGATKLSEEILRLWGRVLASLPSARLLLAGIPQGRARARIVATIVGSAAIDENRLSFLDRMPIEDYLAQIGSVDIMLDSFPYVGATSTCDALWMGVPVVSMKGWRSCSRSGASLLPQVGLADWVAEDADDYLRIIRRWANAPEALQALRQGLRGRMQASPLMDASQFSRDWSVMMHAIWRALCNGET